MMRGLFTIDSCCLPLICTKQYLIRQNEICFQSNRLLFRFGVYCSFRRSIVVLGEVYVFVPSYTYVYETEMYIKPQLV